MPQLSPQFPFPSRGWMLVNLFVYVTFAVLIPLQFGSEMLYVRNWMGLVLFASALVNGGLAMLWLRYFDKLEKRLSQ